MKQKATIDRVLRYIKRKTKATEDGKEVVSKLHAELAAKMAFEGGRLSILDNIQKLEWNEGGGQMGIEDVNSLICYAVTPWNIYGVIYCPNTKTYELRLAEHTLADNCKSVTKAKRFAEEDYNRRVFDVLGLNSKK